MATVAISNKKEMLTLPGDAVRQIQWRFADRFDLQMLVQSSRGVARGTVAQLVAAGERNSHEWTPGKNSMMEAFDRAGITAAFMEPEEGGFISGPKNLALALVAGAVRALAGLRGEPRHRDGRARRGHPREVPLDRRGVVRHVLEDREALVPDLEAGAAHVSSPRRRGRRRCGRTPLRAAPRSSNIIRDVGEDARRGRVYLPLDERFTTRDSESMRRPPNVKTLAAMIG